MAPSTYNVRVYTADFFCPYCVRALSLLDKLAIPYTKIIGELPTGLTTYPQIYFGLNHIGGCDELYTLYRNGKLNSHE